MAAPTYEAVRALGREGATLEVMATLASGKNQDGSAFTLPTTATVSVAAEVTSATATLANIASSATSVTLIALNAARLGGAIYNDSSAILYVKFGSTASATSFTVEMAANSYYELPGTPIYTGVITGIWASATGSARVTELTA